MSFFDVAIFSPYPTKYNSRDGYVQRIQAIDRIIEGKKKLYIELSIFSKFIPSLRKEKDSFVAKGNLFLYFWAAWLAALCAKTIYFHSVIEVTKGLPLLFLKRCIVDLHGVVPEEMEFVGRHILAKIFGYSEKCAASHSKVIVFVTDSLGAHFYEKYGDALGSRSERNKLNSIVLPIFVDDSSMVFEEIAESREGYIYAGGLQAWQNIPKILSFSARIEAFRGVMLVASKTKFLEKYGDTFDTVSSKWLLGSVPQTEVESYCRRAKFGFLIRDNSIVNKVACPTKLIEYISCGVVPILDFPGLGDFKAYGLKYFVVDEFNEIFAEHQYLLYSQENLRIYQKYLGVVCHGKHSLLRWINES